MNILAIGAHPDDIEFGCGGSLVQYAGRGHRVFLHVLTCGGMGGEQDIRKNEQRSSAVLMQAEEVFFGGYTDTELRADKELISTIEDVMRITDPTLIFVNYYDDTHQDHRHLTQATLSATRYVPNVLFYEVPTTNNFSPNVFMNIADVLEEKLKLLEAHESQVFKTNIEDLSIVDVARSLANFRGIQGRVKYAEGFVSQRFFLDIALDR
jgi:LmbE family N-acetylglucosaminyl deacetylase